jgi:hypothetical protein
MIGPPSHPGPPVSRCRPTPRHGAIPAAPMAPLSPFLSSAPPPCGAHPSGPPSSPIPFKTEPPPAGRIFSPRRDFSSLRSDAAPQPPPSPPLEPQAHPAAHRSPRSPDAGHHFCAAAAARVSPTSTPPSRRHPGTPPVLAGSTLPPASPHRTTVKRITAPARTR